MVINGIVVFLHIVGLIIFLGTVVGILRLPDFYSRMHAASKGDTMSSVCFLGGFMIYVLSDFTFPHLLLAIKIFCIIAFIFVSSPTAANALAEAAFKTGSKHFKEEENDLDT